MKKYLLLVTILIPIGFSCSNQKAKPVFVPEIKINFDEKIKIDEKSIVKSTDFFSDCDVVPLETNAESLIKQIDRLILTKNKIFILDRDMKSIFIFDREGHFLSRIKNIGKGPGEYIQIRDFCLNDYDSTLVVTADIPYKLLIYNLDGKFIQERPTKIWFLNISSTSNHIVLYNRRLKGKYKFYLQNKRTNEESYYWQYYKKDVEIRHGMESMNLTRSMNLYFNEEYNDTIYKVDDLSVKPVFYVNFGKYKIPQEFNESKNGRNLFKKIVNNNEMFCLFISNFREYKNHIIFKFNPGCTAIHTKKTNHTVIIDRFSDNKTGLSINYFAHDGFDDVFLSILNSSTIEFYMSNISILKKIYPDLEKLQKKLGTIKKIDNPVLFLYKLKE